MALDPSDPRVEAAVLGRETELFLNTPLGGYLIRRTESEIQSGVERLKYADPEDAPRIRQLQSDIRRAESFQNWLAEAVQAGNQAIASIEGEGADDAAGE